MIHAKEKEASSSENLQVSANRWMCVCVCVCVCWSPQPHWLIIFISLSLYSCNSNNYRTLWLTSLETCPASGIQVVSCIILALSWEVQPLSLIIYYCVCYYLIFNTQPTAACISVSRCLFLSLSIQWKIKVQQQQLPMMMLCRTSCRVARDREK